ncbi:MAG TPA: hypothetical protein VKY92_21175 [Verrucomicrobiae bacterium]|nr:hypothetical protein [Verrucomicrobiae bacterium]
MRLLILTLLVACSFHGSTALSAETAQGRVWCLSLKFQQGSDSFGDTLDLSTISGTPNGELEPYNNLTYISGFTLDISGMPIFGTMQLNLPPFQDTDGDGFNDFFESAVGVSATTSGSYTAGPETGSVTATWQRGAGTSDGSCALHLVDSTFGDLGTFNHIFSILEYTGAVLYVSGSNSVSGTVNLFKTGDTNSQLAGPYQFVKVSTNHFNRLILQPGFWTNESALPLSFTNDLYRRDLPWTTNYWGLLEFSDGDPSTAAPDYLAWLWSIDDTNDSNHNGIPDFSDDPQTVLPPSTPQLSFTWTSSNVVISVSGSIGHVHDFQQALSLPSTNWQTILSVTLTNNQQRITLTNTQSPVSFWRAVAH